MLTSKKEDLREEKWDGERENFISRIKKNRICQVILICSLWFSTSSLSNLLGKEILNRFKYPLTLTLVHLISTGIYSFPLLFYNKLRSFPVSRYFFLCFVIPLTLLRVATMASGHFSVSKIPLSFSQTRKLTI